MKKHKLDNLFSDKLEGHQSQPKPESWETLEKSLARHSPKPLWTWVSIAASAALVALSSWFILSADSSTNTNDYAYSLVPTEEVDVPLEIVLVPVFIQVPVVNTTSEEPINIQKTQVAKNDEEVVALPKDTEQVPIVLADTKVLEHQLAPIIQEPLPLDSDKADELIMASAKETIVEEQQNTLEPLTIIYKQGEAEPESNFTKAINYMEDVRNGDKKLLNFRKIGDSIKSKFKSNKEVNSK
jgi:hypothetical protein